MTLPPSIHRQFLVSLIISLPLIALLVWAATYMENRFSPESGESSPMGQESQLREDECSTHSPLTLEMLDALGRGRFSYARYLALQSQNDRPQCESKLAALYTQHADAFLTTMGALGTVIQMLADERVRLTAPIDAADCWNPAEDDRLDSEEAARIVLDQWDVCCSQLKPAGKPETRQCSQDGRRMCCGFFRGSLSHLRLPALQEVAIRLRLPFDGMEENGVTLEQDGFLRKYDPAGVLWPAGYLLSICLADPHRCGIPEVLEAAHACAGNMIGLELGAGIGVPGLVLTRLLQLHKVMDQQPKVLVTDRAMYALGLTATNSLAMGAPVLISILQDHTNMTQLDQLGRDKYAIVLGSSMESLFDWKTRDPYHTLWKVLDKLMDPTNPKAIAVLAHVVGAVVPPNEEDASFELIRIVSGNDLEMRTRTGDDSDFAISVYRRKVSPQEGHQEAASVHGEL